MKQECYILYIFAHYHEWLDSESAAAEPGVSVGETVWGRSAVQEDIF